MQDRRGMLREFPKRGALVALTLFSHLLATCGFPLPGLSLNPTKDANLPFPCQNRPCGCLSADQCWQGDCCCMTLEEKATWAQANQIEPPPHVHSMIQARKQQDRPHPKSTCCSLETEEPNPEDTRIAAACCRKTREIADHSEATGRPSGVRWVIGPFSQKCRGQGPAGLFLLDCSLVMEPPWCWLPDRRAERIFPGPRMQPSSPTQCPPIPPPRLS